MGCTDLNICPCHLGMGGLLPRRSGEPGGVGWRVGGVAIRPIRGLCCHRWGLGEEVPYVQCASGSPESGVAMGLLQVGGELPVLCFQGLSCDGVDFAFPWLGGSSRCRGREANGQGESIEGQLVAFLYFLPIQQAQVSSADHVCPIVRDQFTLVADA